MNEHKINLRQANLIPHRSEIHRQEQHEHEQQKARLIDFDLSGRVGVRQYPAGFNALIEDGARHPTATGGRFLEFVHDLFAFVAVCRLFQTGAAAGKPCAASGSVSGSGSGGGSGSSCGGGGGGGSGGGDRNIQNVADDEEDDDDDDQSTKRHKQQDRWNAMLDKWSEWCDSLSGSASSNSSNIRVNVSISCSSRSSAAEAAATAAAASEAAATEAAAVATAAAAVGQRMVDALRQWDNASLRPAGPPPITIGTGSPAKK